MSIRQKRVRSEFEQSEELDKLLSEGWLIVMSFPFHFEDDLLCVEYILEREFSELDEILNNKSTDKLKN